MIAAFRHIFRATVAFRRVFRVLLYLYNNTWPPTTFPASLEHGWWVISPEKPPGRAASSANLPGAGTVSSAELPAKPAGHQSSSDLPALVITSGNFRCRSGRAGTVICLGDGYG